MARDKFHWTTYNRIIKTRNLSKSPSGRDRATRVSPDPPVTTGDAFFSHLRVVYVTRKKIALINHPRASLLPYYYRPTQFPRNGFDKFWWWWGRWRSDAASARWNVRQCISTSPRQNPEHASHRYDRYAWSVPWYRTGVRVRLGLGNLTNRTGRDVRSAFGRQQYIYVLYKSRRFTSLVVNLKQISRRFVLTNKQRVQF